MKITPKQKKSIAKIVKKHRLKLVVLFGSFAVRKNREDSDMDIAILGREKISFREIINLIGELMKIFHKNVDISVLNNANPLLLYQASQNSVLLFGKEKDFLAFKLYAFHRYNDYLPYFELERRLNKRIIKQYAHK